MYGPASGGRGGGRDGPPRERQFTPRGQMSSGANSAAPLSDLPPHMRMMFQPRPPIQFLPPFQRRECAPYSGIADLVHNFETTPPPPRPHFEAPVEKKKSTQERLNKLNDEKNEMLLSDWDPQSNPKAISNAYHTLFVGRLSFETTEKKLKREMEQYGPVKSVSLVTDTEGKSRGYAFVEFENEQDLTVAYKKADGKKIDGRRVVVDVERGRTVRNWRPRRLGGGLGGRKPVKSKKTLQEEAKKALAGGAGPSKPGSYGASRPGPSGEDRPPRRESSDSSRYSAPDSKYGPPPSSGQDYRSQPPVDSKYGPPADSRYGPPSDSRYGPGGGGGGGGASGGAGLGWNDRKSGEVRRSDRSRSRDRGDRDRESRGDRDKDARDRERNREPRDRERDRERDRGGDRDRYREPERRRRSQSRERR